MQTQCSRVRNAVMASAAFTALISICATSFAQGASVASDEVLVTASRLGNARTDLLGASYTILGADQLQNRHVLVVSDILRSVPGIQVNRLGPAGSFTQVRMRGGESNHTLTMIDGLEASEPFSGEFDYASLVTDDVAKVEILRGQQSALYGSNAIGGVIHYITLTGAEAPGFTAKVEGGSFGTVASSARYAGISGAVDYALSATAYRTNGSIGARNGIRYAGSENQTVTAKTAVTLADNLRVTAIGRFTNMDAETTPQDFGFPPGAFYGLTYDRTLTPTGLAQVKDRTEARNLYGLLRADLSLMNDNWLHAITVQGVDGDRKNYGDLGVISSQNVGTRQKASYVSTFKFGSDTLQHSLTAAIDYKRETYQNKAVGGAAPAPLNAERSLDNTGIVGQYDLRIADTIGFGASIRHDANEHFKDATTYRFQAGYKPVQSLRLRAAYGTGITNPTNSELFGFNPLTFIGNPNLKPELSKGWEAGLDYDIWEGFKIGATYFDSVLTDEIFTNFTPAFLSTPTNRVTDSTQKGVEVWGELALSENFDIDFSYTNLAAFEGAPRLVEIRRPRHIASANLSWHMDDDRLKFNLGANYNGAQRDQQFTPLGAVRVKQPSYTLVNIGVDYKATESWNLYGRVENALNDHYEEVFGFPGTGAAIYIGVKTHFE